MLKGPRAQGGCVCLPPNEMVQVSGDHEDLKARLLGLGHGHHFVCFINNEREGINKRKQQMEKVFIIKSSYGNNTIINHQGYRIKSISKTTPELCRKPLFLPPFSLTHKERECALERLATGLMVTKEMS